MKKLLFLIVVALMLTGCVVYPGYYDGYYDSGYYNSPYGYVSPNVNPCSAACCGKPGKFGVVLCETITISRSVL